MIIEPINIQGKIVRPDFKKGRDRISITPIEKFCRHGNCKIDEYSRTVKCGDCGASMSPYDFLHHWARGFLKLEYEKRRLRQEVTQLQEQVDALKRDERNTKARMRKISDVLAEEKNEKKRR